MEQWDAISLNGFIKPFCFSSLAREKMAISTLWSNLGMAHFKSSGIYLVLLHAVNWKEHSFTKHISALQSNGAKEAKT